MPRALTTRERLASAALRLFERRGYDHTTVEDIARETGVSHMTFFRHFPTKESVLIGDPFDPLIARCVAAQPNTPCVIERVARGLSSALNALDARVDKDVRRRIRVAAGVPALRASMIENNRATEDAIVEALTASGADEFASRVATAACLAAITTALFRWAAVGSDAVTLAQTVHEALSIVSPSPPRALV